VRPKSRRDAPIQAARRFHNKPSIILIKGASIIVIALKGGYRDFWWMSPTHHPNLTVHIAEIGYS
jgi:hypothetical protein